ncbi:hypothetical protein TNCV_774951 [Trichonephila clavipes]|nr:hypothetical protein TNCV_774951 [Trichonephila clavipes]
MQHFLCSCPRLVDYIILGQLDWTCGSCSLATTAITYRHCGSLVVKVSNRGSHELQPSTTKDPPCREPMHVKYVESTNVLSLCEVQENTVGGYNLFSAPDPELGKMIVQYKKERMELLVSKLRTSPVWYLTAPIIFLSQNKYDDKHKFKKRKAKHELLDGFVFRNKTARPSSLSKTEEQIKTQNNFENLPQAFACT